MTGHIGHYLAEVLGFLVFPAIYAVQRLIRRAVARSRGLPWPPPQMQAHLPASGRDPRTVEPPSSKRDEDEQG